MTQAELGALVGVDGSSVSSWERGERLPSRDRVYRLYVALNVKEAPDLVQRLEVKSLPTTVIIETNGDVVDSISGYQTPKQLRQRLHATLRLVAQERENAQRR